MISLAQYLLWLKSVRCTHYLWFRWSISFLKPQQRHGKFVTGKPVVGAGRAVTVTPLRTHGSCPSLQPCFGKSLSARGEFGPLWNSGKRPLRLRLHIPHLPFLSAPPPHPQKTGNTLYTTAGHQPGVQNLIFPSGKFTPILRCPRPLVMSHRPSANSRVRLSWVNT